MGHALNWKKNIFTHDVVLINNQILQFESGMELGIAQTAKLTVACVVVLSLTATSIATDKRGYLHNIFLISPQKHKLWVLI